MSIRKLALSATALAGLTTLLWVPLPHRIYCSFYLEPRDAELVYAEVPGVLDRVFVQPGDRVSAGQPIAALANPDLLIELRTQRQRRERLLIRYELAARQAIVDHTAGGQLAELETALRAVDAKIQQRLARLARLRPTTKQAGTVLPISSRRQAPPSPRLPRWHGQPLEERNLGAMLEEGTPICRIGDPTRMQAVLALPEEDLPFVQVGQSVELFPEQLPGTGLRTTLQHVGRRRMETAPAGVSVKMGGGLVTHTDQQGRERLSTAAYHASAPLDMPGPVAAREPGGPREQEAVAPPLTPGGRGIARITVGRECLAARGWRSLQRTLRLE